MIYSIFIIDGDSAILILENSFKKLAHFEEGQESQVLAGFFKGLNSTIDDIHTAMRKGRDVSRMDRIINSEGASVVLHFHPEGRILFAAIADADDSVETIISILKALARRFWKKHFSDVDQFRINNNKEIFKSFLIEIQMMTLNGRIAQLFPKLIVTDATLNRIYNMGMISKQELIVARMCNESISPLQISRKSNLSQAEVQVLLKHLGELDVLKFEK